MEPSLRIVGIDPGLQITGYALLEGTAPRPVVREAGVIRPPRDADLPTRLSEIYEGVTELMKQYEPQVMAVEQLYAHYKHPRTAILMGHARGAVLLAAGQAGVPVLSYSATRIKKTITGHGRAPKDQVQRTVMRELSLLRLPEPPDVADALAVALCHFYLQRSLA
jgi:crossover junction endodeoxyribonuclease RuvC